METSTVKDAELVTNNEKSQKESTGSWKDSLFWQFLKENWFLIFLVIYVLVPTDLIPDFIPLVGGLDDSAMVIIEIVRRVVEFKKSQRSK